DAASTSEPPARGRSRAGDGGLSRSIGWINWGVSLPDRSSLDRNTAPGRRLANNLDLRQRRSSLGNHVLLSRSLSGSRQMQFASARRRTDMHPGKRLSMRVTVAGLAASALLGLAGVTLNPTPAKAVVYCQYVDYPPSCVARAGVVLRPRPVARAA